MFIYYIPIYNTLNILMEISHWDKTILVYSKKSWKELQKYIQHAKNVLLYEAETQSMPSVKDLLNMQVKNIIIEEADLFYNQYDGVRFKFEELFEEYLTAGIQIYFSATWKKPDIEENLQKYSIDVINYEIIETPKSL